MAALWLLTYLLTAAVATRVMDEYRIPENVRPVHYKLKLLTSLTDDFLYNGEVWVDVQLKTATDKITLNSKNLIIFENETKLETVGGLRRARMKRETDFGKLRRLAMRSRKSHVDQVDGKKTGLLGLFPKDEKKPQNADKEVNDRFQGAEVEVNKVHVPVLPVDESREEEVSEDTAQEEQKPTTTGYPTTSTERATEQSTTVKTTEQPTTEQPTTARTTEQPFTEPSTTARTTEQPTTETLTTTYRTTTQRVTSTTPTPSTEKVTVSETESTTAAEPSTTAGEEYNKEDGPEVLLHDYDTEKDFLTIRFSRELEPGKNYRLYLKFQGFLSDTLTGFYRVAYGKKGTKKTTWLASTVFEPLEARTAFPCWDEPEYKSTFEISLGHEKKFTALSNMPLKESRDMKEKLGWQWDTYETTPKMSSYLVAFLISDFEHLAARTSNDTNTDTNTSTNTNTSTTFRFWARRDVLQKTRYAMKIVPDIKTHLEGLFGVKDPLPKHDFVALPSFISSALENWGLVSFSERALLYNPGFSSLLSKFETTELLGHEVAHMWFGNSVTPKWWDQVWLSEGFANYFEVVAADHVQPTWDVKSIALVYSYLRIFSIDAMHTTHPLVPRVEHPRDLNEIFDSVTYQKGFYLIRMMNLTLGEDTFMKGVRKYLEKHQQSTVEEEDLWDALTEEAHADGTLPKEYHLKELMHSWTRKAGYPIVEVVRDYDNKTAVVTQRRFLRPKYDYELRSKAENSSEVDTKWYIPLTYTNQAEMMFNDTRPRVWLKPENDETLLSDMPTENEFVLMNLDVAGLYRVNYDDRNWALIIDHLLSENYSSISVINRVQILDDLLDFARAGEVTYEKALDATNYLKKEPHYLPWKAALSNFEYILRMLRTTDSNKAFKKYLRNLIAPRFDQLGFEGKKNESFCDNLNRKQVLKWACRTGLRQCTRKSVSLFKKWTEERKPDEHNPIPSNIRSIVYCTAIEHGGAKDWQFLWQRYLSNAVVTDKTSILAGLGCSKNTRTLRKYLDWSLKESSGLKKQDSAAVFKAVARNDVGAALAKDFLKERLPDIQKYVGNNQYHMPQLIEAVANNMNQPKHLKELEEMAVTHRATLKSVPRSLKQANERVQFNIGWVEQHHQTVSDWLKKQKL